jgi:hypothetical protein
MVAGDWVVGSAPRLQGRHTTNTAAEPPGRGLLPYRWISRSTCYQYLLKAGNRIERLGLATERSKDHE